MNRTPNILRSSRESQSRNTGWAEHAILVQQAVEAWRIAVQADLEVELNYEKLSAARPRLARALTVREKDAIATKDLKIVDGEPRFRGLRGEVKQILEAASPEGVHVTHIYDEVRRLRMDRGKDEPVWADPLANVEDPCWYFKKIGLPVVLVAPRTWAWRPDAETGAITGDTMS